MTDVARPEKPFLAPGDEEVADMVGRFVAAGEQVRYEGSPVGRYEEHYRVARSAASALLEVIRATDDPSAPFDLIAVSDLLRTQLAQGEQ